MSEDKQSEPKDNKNTSQECDTDFLLILSMSLKKMLMQLDCYDCVDCKTKYKSICEW